MKHDVQIVCKKEKKLTSLTQYTNTGLVMTKEQRAMMKERKRVERLLSPTYYANKNAI